MFYFEEFVLAVYLNLKNSTNTCEYYIAAVRFHGFPLLIVNLNRFRLTWTRWNSRTLSLSLKEFCVDKDHLWDFLFVDYGSLHDSGNMMSWSFVSRNICYVILNFRNDREINFFLSILPKNICIHNLANLQINSWCSALYWTVLFN